MIISAESCKTLAVARRSIFANVSIHNFVIPRGWTIESAIRFLFSQTVYRIVTRVYKYVQVHPTPRVIYDTRVHDVTGETTAGKREQRQKEETGEREREIEIEKARTENEVAAMVTGGWWKGGRGTSMVAED